VGAFLIPAGAQGRNSRAAVQLIC